MRVVLDTNVLARPSFSKAGPAAELLDRLKAPDHLLIISPFIVSELERALRYPRLQRLHGFDDQALARYLADIEEASLLVDVPEGGVTAVSPDDPDDLESDWRPGDHKSLSRFDLV